MATVQPAKKINELILRLDALDISEDHSNNIDVLKAKRFAEKEIKNAPFDAYMLMGMVACIENDIDKMKSSHENAIRLSGGHAVSYYQYAVSLARRGLFKESLDYAEKALALIENKVQYLDTVIASAYGAGDTDKVKEYSLRWLESQKDYHPLHLAVMTDDEYLDVIYSDPEHVEALEYLANN